MRWRKVLPPRLLPFWEAFEAQAARVESASGRVVAEVPVGRVAVGGAAPALDALAVTLGEVRLALPQWRVDELEAQWCACRDATDEARDAAVRAAEVARDSGELGDVLAVIDDVLGPLEAWREAEERWHQLRTRRGRSGWLRLG